MYYILNIRRKYMQLISIFRCKIMHLPSNIHKKNMHLVIVFQHNIMHQPIDIRRKNMHNYLYAAKKNL